LENKDITDYVVKLLGVINPQCMCVRELQYCLFVYLCAEDLEGRCIKTIKSGTVLKKMII